MSPQLLHGKLCRICRSVLPLNAKTVLCTTSRGSTVKSQLTDDNSCSGRNICDKPKGIRPSTTGKCCGWLRKAISCLIYTAQACGGAQQSEALKQRPRRRRSGDDGHTPYLTAYADRVPVARARQTRIQAHPEEDEKDETTPPRTTGYIAAHRS